MILKAFTLFLVSTTAQAAIVRSLDEMKVIEVPISQHGLTRIKVQDDRILHVFGNAGEYVLETDENQGQVFIRPTSLEGSSVKAISLTLTTEAGYTQDLRLLPKDQTPEALIFKADQEIKQEIEKEKQASVPFFREEVEALIQALREERIPLGYKEMPIRLAIPHESYPLVRELQGEALRGLTYRVQNKTPDRLVLSESELVKELSISRSLGEGGPLKSSTIIAILISQKALNPGEGADIYVVARTN
ncbi:MAG: hypothetical protein BGO67_03905 [Alphaproteobacteria bacterium 41-28]|nr:MAG: hypothetical protein BGO67_03905 [Alphaproteobacteria bacterium 41-28]